MVAERCPVVLEPTPHSYEVACSRCGQTGQVVVSVVERPADPAVPEPGDEEWPDRSWLISHWVGHRCGYVDCRITEQHEHGGGQPMREMSTEEVRAALATDTEEKA